MTKIPFLDLNAATAEIRADVDAAFARALDTSAFIGGASVANFERTYADYCETEHAVAVANGTDALQLILRALGVGPGDEVIVPANTFIATAEAVALLGAKPVFTDVDPGTLLLTAEGVRRALGPRTRAVMAVHLYGQPVDVDAIREVTDPVGVHVVEDAAQAQGARLRGRRVGSLGAAAGFSFYPGKNLGAAGDAGAVTTDDADLAELVRGMANHGRTSHHAHAVLGTNSRMDALQAEFLLAKLPRLDAWNARRRELHARYVAGLDGSGAHPVAVRDDVESVHHLEVVQVADRPRFRATLDATGIGTGVHYPVACHLAPAFADLGGAIGDHPVAEAAADRIVSLPMFPQLSDADVDRVIEVVAGLRMGAAA